MTDVDATALAHAAIARRDWREAYRRLAEADGNSSLGASDLEWLAVAAHLTAQDQLAHDAYMRAHQAYADKGEVRAAVRCAFHLGMSLMQRGDVAQAGGWLGRAKGILDEHELDCAERGLLLIPAALQTLMGGDPDGALRIFEQACEVGRRFGDADVLAFGRLGAGQALLEAGETDKGLALFDEAMVGVTAGEVSPVVAGILYCAVIDGCQEVFDVGRAKEWTAALSRWCEDQPGLVMFRGQCLVHRCQIMQLRGEWPDALEEVRHARERLSDPPGQPAIGAALYEQAELHRLRGEFGKAEAAYREANEWGKSPQPGLAALRLAQGQGESAVATMRRCLEEASSVLERSRLLPVAVEVFLSVGHLDEARTAAAELFEIASERSVAYLDAVASLARGAVSLAGGDPSAALPDLRRACAAWMELDAPYEAARTRAFIGAACQRLGDADTADLEHAAARRAFEELGASPAVIWLEQLRGEAGPRDGRANLSPREVEVLRLVAAGKTNRGIATELIISEKTVARHVSNIFAKLGVPSRAAATAYAYENRLV